LANHREKQITEEHAALGRALEAKLAALRDEVQLSRSSGASMSYVPVLEL